MVILYDYCDISIVNGVKLDQLRTTGHQLASGNNSETCEINFKDQGAECAAKTWSFTRQKYLKLVKISLPTLQIPVVEPLFPAV
jgi:hypothetical protein